MKLLQQRDLKRRERRLRLQAETRKRLHAALTELIPGSRVILFGSVTKPGVFHDRSDVDLALVDRSPGIDPVWLTGELMERLARPVDVLLLDTCRFREKIRREGEEWTL